MTDDLKAPERTFDHPYELSHSDGEWWTLKSNGFVVASFSLKTWGSAERIIEAAWQYAYGQPDADRIATLEAALAETEALEEQHGAVIERLRGELADMTQQRDAAMAGAVSVRELAWEQLGERAWRAPSPLFGSFRVERYGDRLWQALWSVPGICDTFVEGDFATADDAKQAIQARILSALTPDPDRMLALTAAAYEDAVSGLERDIEDREIDAARFRAGTNPHHYRMNLAQAIRYHAAQIRARIPADAISALSRIEAQAEARGMRKAATELPHRVENLGGQSYAYVRIEEILALAAATEAAAKGGV